MPVPTVITDLSTTAASNYPAGTEAPNVIDDTLRAHGAFIRQLYDGPVATVDGSAGAPAHAFVSDPDTGAYRVTTNAWGVATAGTSRMTVGASGNVTINAPSSGAPLSVVANSSSTLGDSFKVTITGGQGFYFNSLSSGTVNNLAVGTGETLNLSVGTSTAIGISGNRNVTINSPASGYAFNIPAQAPASASDTGVQGTISWDSSYIYVCTATNTWKRAALSTW